MARSETETTQDSSAGKEGAVARLSQWALDSALNIDRGEARADVRALRARYPSDSRYQLAKRLVARTRWKGTAAGVLTGLPSNPWVAGGAAALDVAALLRINISMAARIALLFDEKYLDDSEPPYELLVPVFGGRFASELAREAAIRAGMGVTRALIRAYISKGVLKTVKRFALKYLGLKITQRALITTDHPRC